MRVAWNPSCEEDNYQRPNYVTLTNGDNFLGSDEFRFPDYEGPMGGGSLPTLLLPLENGLETSKSEPLLKSQKNPANKSPKSPSDGSPKMRKLSDKQIFKSSIKKLPSMYLTELLPFIKSTKLNDFTINIQYHPPKSRHQTYRKLRPLTKHTKKRKRNRKTVESKKINNLIRHEMKPLRDMKKTQRLEMQKRWFALITLCNSGIVVYNLMRSTKLNGRRTIKERRASLIIQRNWKNYYTYRMGLLTRNVNKIFPFFFLRIKFNMRAKVRRQKAKIVRWYISQFTHFTKVNVAIQMYRYRIIQAQRLVRGWLVCKGARLDALCRKWSKVEHKYRFKLRHVMKTVHEQLKIREQNDTSLLTVARKMRAEMKRPSGKKQGAEKLKKGSIVMKILQEDVAPMLQASRETLGISCLSYGQQMITALAINPTALSKDGNPRKRMGSRERKRRSSSISFDKIPVRAPVERLPKESRKYLSGKTAAKDAGSVVPLPMRLLALQKQLMKARRQYVTCGADAENLKNASSTFNPSDMERILRADVSVQDVLSSKQQALGLFKPYTSSFFSVKEMAKLIEKSLQDTAQSTFYQS
jgi:hypothetical protein